MLSDDNLYVGIDNVTKFASCPGFFFRYDDLQGVVLLSFVSQLTKCVVRFTLYQRGQPGCQIYRGDLLYCDALFHSICRCGVCRHRCRFDNFQGEGGSSHDEDHFIYNR